MKTKPYAYYSSQEPDWNQNNRIEGAALDMLQCLEDIIGEAAFEGLPESKQEAIHAALAKAKNS